MRTLKFFIGDVAVYSVVLAAVVLGTGFQMEVIHGISV